MNALALLAVLRSAYSRLGLAERALILLVAVYAVANAVWIWRYRHGQPLDIDEAGYLLMSLVDYRGFLADGVVGWLGAVEAPNPQAPLTAAVTSLLQAAFGPTRDMGFVVSIAFGCVTVLATYALGKMISGRKDVGLLAAVLVATVPTLLGETRSFHFAIVAAATTSVALIALLKSREFTRLPWSLLFGASLTFIVLSRTMTIAYLPGLIIPAILVALAAERRREAFRQLLLAGGAALFTAAMWNVDSWAAALAYLRGFGYGSQSHLYGTTDNAFSLDAWVALIHRLSSEMHLPYALIIALGLVGLVVAGVRNVRAADARTMLRGAVRSPLFPLAFLCVEGLLALRSSRNEGTAFVAPLLPAFFALSALGLRELFGARFRVAGAGVALGTLALTAATFDLSQPAAGPRIAQIPLFGYSVLSDGRAPIEQYEAVGGYRSANRALPVDSRDGAEWVRINDALSHEIAARNVPGKAAALGFRHYLLNANTINLEHGLRHASLLPFVGVDVQNPGPPVEGYRKWLTQGDAATSCLLLTATGAIGEIPPAVDSDAMAAAARQAGFSVASRATLPDGRDLVFWRRPSQCRPA